MGEREREREREKHVMASTPHLPHTHTDSPNVSVCFELGHFREEQSLHSWLRHNTNLQVTRTHTHTHIYSITIQKCVCIHVHVCPTVLVPVLACYYCFCE